MEDTKSLSKKVVCTKCAQPLPFPDSVRYLTGNAVRNCKKCNPSTPNISYVYRDDRWEISSYLASCMKCGEGFKKPGCVDVTCTPEITCNLCNLFYCQNCDPSYDDIKFTYSSKGWTTTATRYKCTTCDLNIYVNQPYLKYHLIYYCRKCNPSDDHNKYEYSKKYKTFVLIQEWIYDAKTGKHSWMAAEHAHKHKCDKCERDKSFQEQNTYYGKKFKQNLKPPSTTRRVKTNTGESKIIAIASDDIACPVTLIVATTGMSWDICVLMYEYAEYTFRETYIKSANLRKANYNGCNFSKSRFVACDLTKADFSRCILLEASFNYCILKNVDWTGAQLENNSYMGSDLTEEKYLDKTLKQVNFTGAKLNGVVFRNTVIENCIFVGADLTNAVFEECRLSNVNLSYANLTNTRFNKINIKHCCFIETILTGTIFTCGTISDLDFTSACFDKIKFESLNLMTVNLSNINLDDCSLLNCIFNTNTRLSKSSFVRSKLHSCYFAHIAMNHANFEAAFLCESTFDTCNLRKASFLGTHFSKATLNKCDVEQAYFRRVDFRNTQFTSISLSTADMSKCNLDGAILKNCITPDEESRYPMCTINGFTAY